MLNDEGYFYLTNFLVLKLYAFAPEIESKCRSLIVNSRRHTSGLCESKISNPKSLNFRIFAPLFKS